MTGNQKTRRHRAFIPIGIALIVIGFSQETGLAAAGVVFLIIGINAAKRDRAESAVNSSGK